MITAVGVVASAPCRGGSGIDHLPASVIIPLPLKVKLHQTCTSDGSPSGTMNPKTSLVLKTPHIPELWSHSRQMFFDELVHRRVHCSIHVLAA